MNKTEDNRVLDPTITKAVIPSTQIVGFKGVSANDYSTYVDSQFATPEQIRLGCFKEGQTGTLLPVANNLPGLSHVLINTLDLYADVIKWIHRGVTQPGLRKDTGVYGAVNLRRTLMKPINGNTDPNPPHGSGGGKIMDPNTKELVDVNELVSTLVLKVPLVTIGKVPDGYEGHLVAGQSTIPMLFPIFLESAKNKRQFYSRTIATGQKLRFDVVEFTFEHAEGDIRPYAVAVNPKF